MAGELNSTRKSVPDARDLKIAEQAVQIKNLEARLKELEDKLAKLKALLASAAEVKSSKAPDVHRELQPQPKQDLREETTHEIDRSQADTIKVFANRVDQDKCIRHRSQFAWRIVAGKAVKKVESEESRDESVNSLDSRLWAYS